MGKVVNSIIPHSKLLDGKKASIIGFSSVELPQLTDTIRGNKVVGQVALLAQHQPLGWKIFPKKNPFKTDFFLRFFFFFLKQF